MIQWTYKSIRDSEFAIFTVGQLKVTVQNFHGDDVSEWTIVEESPENGTVTLQQGVINFEDCETSKYHRYHFDVARERAEKALIGFARDRGLYKD